MDALNKDMSVKSQKFLRRASIIRTTVVNAKEKLGITKGTIMNDKRFLLSSRQLKALKNLPLQPSATEIDILWDRLMIIDAKSYIKMLVDTESTIYQIATELGTRWYMHKETSMPIIRAPMPPAASYLKTIRKIEFASIDYLIVIAQPSTWGAIVKRLYLEQEWNADKLILSPNLLKPNVRKVIGHRFYADKSYSVD